MEARIDIAASDELVLIEASIGDQYVIDRISPDAADALALRLIRCAAEAREYVAPDPTAACPACNVRHALTSIAANNDHCPSCGEKAIPF